MAIGTLSALAGALAFQRYTHRPPRQALQFQPASGAATAQTNVVVVIGCTVRADQTTPYGAPTHVTPFLESVAQDGTRMAGMISQAPWTRPAVTALTTSRHALGIGLTEPGPDMNDRALPQGVVTLAEHMAASGRATYGWTANPNASELFDFHQGFDEFGEGKTVRWATGGVQKADGTALAQTALRRIAQHDATDGRPFYLQVLFVDAHQPDPTHTLEKARFREAGVPNRAAAYRARLRRLDTAVQALWDGLGKLGHDESNTVFVFVGDHGEGLSWPAHHGRAHGRYLYGSVAHVPWLMRGPGVARGHVVNGIARSVDLVPTLLAHLGLPEAPDAKGVALAQQIRGDASQTPTQRAFIDTWFRQSNRTAVYTPTHMCQRDWAPMATEAWETQRRNRGQSVPRFRDACFERADPRMKTDVADPSGLRIELEVWRKERLAERKAAEALGAGAVEVDRETIEALQALGYAGD